MSGIAGTLIHCLKPDRAPATTPIRSIPHLPTSTVPIRILPFVPIPIYAVPIPTTNLVYQIPTGFPFSAARVSHSVDISNCQQTWKRWSISRPLKQRLCIFRSFSISSFFVNFRSFCAINESGYQLLAYVMDFVLHRRPMYCIWQAWLVCLLWWQQL